MNWDEIIKHPAWKKLSADGQFEARRRWVDDVYLPDVAKAGVSPEGQQIVRQDALMEWDNGQGGVSSFFNAAGRGVAGLASGVVGGVGAITGLDGLMQTADEMDAAVNNALPVNPSMPKTNFVGGALGQAAGVLGTAFTGGALAKGLAGARGIVAGPALTAAVETGSEAAAMGSGVLSGARQGAEDADKYGLTGGDYAARVLLGGATEYFTEKIPFGLGTETAAAKRLLGAGERAVGKRTLTFSGGVVSESLEEGISQVASNASNMALAAPGVETPGVLSDVPSSMAGGAIGGAGFGLVNLATGSQADPGALPPPAGFTDPANPAAPAAAPLGPVTAAGAAAAVPPALVAARAIPPGNNVTLNGLPFLYSEPDGGWLRPSTPDELLADPTALMRPLNANDPAEGAVIPQLFAKAEAWHRKQQAQKDTNQVNAAPAVASKTAAAPIAAPAIAAPDPRTAALEEAFRGALANPELPLLETPNGETVEVTPESLVAAFRRATGQVEAPASNTPAGSSVATTDPAIQSPAQDMGRAEPVSGKAVEGRAQPLTAPVYTPAGPVAIGSLRLGDSIIAADGTTQQVTGVFPQGTKSLYNLHLADGPTAPATKDHLWLARRDNAAPEVVTTARLMQGLKAGELWEIPMLAAS